MRLVTYTPATRCSSPSLLEANPFAMLEAEMNRLFGQKSASEENKSSASWLHVEINEEEKAYTLTAALPGFRKEDISLEVLDGALNIKASREWKVGETSRTQSFERSLGLSEDVDAETITASQDNGLLTVTIAKRELPKPRKIAVN